MNLKPIAAALGLICTAALAQSPSYDADTVWQTMQQEQRLQDMQRAQEQAERRMRDAQFEAEMRQRQQQSAMQARSEQRMRELEDRLRDLETRQMLDLP
jgi:hypothetical protein